MSTATIVHESEAQRQYPRVRLPATVRFTAGGERRAHQVRDLSAGGFSFSFAKESYRPGEEFHGQLIFVIDHISIGVVVEFKVTEIKADGRRVSCVFQNLGPGQVSALRHIITSFLSGEVVTAGEMLTTLSRENFVATRAASMSGSLGAIGRLRGLIVSGLIFVMGLAAFAYAGTKLYAILFVTHSTAAKVAAPVLTVNMPRDGTFRSLIADDGSIKKGAPLGSFETAMLNVLQGDAAALHLSPDQIAGLLSQQLKGTIASPCDCQLHKRFVADGQYVDRNQPLLQLLPEGAKPYVLARFHYDQIATLKPGRAVKFRLGNSQELLDGRVEQLRTLPAPTPDVSGYSDLSGLNNSGNNADMLVVIAPAKPLDSALIEQPVDVSFSAFDDLFRRLTAGA